MDIQYRPGHTNVVADVLSRRPDYQLNALATMTQDDALLKALHAAYQHDKSALFKTSKSSFQFFDGVRYLTDSKGIRRVYIPEDARSLQQSILELHHDQQLPAIWAKIRPWPAFSGTLGTQSSLQTSGGLS